MTNHLYYGDNLRILREHIADESVDLIYLDPPFNSNASYNVLFKGPGGNESQAQIEAFDDTWHWTEAAEQAFSEVIGSGNTDAAEMLRAMRSFLGENDMMAYLAMMAVRLIELHRVLKPTGSLYLHCDPTASHYLKTLLDAIFGARCFKSEIVWKRSSAHNDAKQGLSNYGHIHDTIFFYTKGQKWAWTPIFTPYEEEYTGRDYKLIEEGTGRRFRRGDLTAAKPGGDVSYEWRVKKRAGVRERWIADLSEEYLTPIDGWEYKGVYPYKGRYWAYSKENMRTFAQDGRLRHTFDGMPEYKRYLDEMPGVPLQDVWTDIRPLLGHERLGYPTEKPPLLLERIISASSNIGDVVLDPFCGCGTTVHAAEKLGRKWIGIDITHLAVTLIRRRLADAFGDQLSDYKLHGVPTDLSGAKALAEQDKHEFEKWAITLIPNAQPRGREQKKGADRGIDGILFMGKKSQHKGIISIKGGQNVSVAMVRDLIGTMEREKATMGIFLTLAEPTRPMSTEAAAAGFWKTEWGDIPRVQIVTVQQMLEGHRPRTLPTRSDTFRKAAREEDAGRQGALDL